MSWDNLIQNEAFKSIEPEMINSLKDFALAIQDKSMEEILPMFIEFYKEMRPGFQMEKEVREALIQTMLEALPVEERNKFSVLYNKLK